MSKAVAKRLRAPQTPRQSAPGPAELPPPPRAEQRPHSFEYHGHTVEDPYAWLRDKGYPKVTDENVLNYLKAENAYFEAWKAPHEALLGDLFEEMKGRIKGDDSSVPVRDGDWLYWTKFEAGAQYKQWYRKRVGGGDDELIYD
jgi:oligopeptidase B